MRSLRQTLLLFAAGLCLATLLASSRAQPSAGKQPTRQGQGTEGRSSRAPPTILRDAVSPIDLATALKLTGAENPELQFTRQCVVEATAVRQLAAAQILPNLNLGTNYDLHRGALQQSNGNILRVDRATGGITAGVCACGDRVRRGSSGCSSRSAATRASARTR